jgi:metal-responsive CopG/Arc/MetJ family transcriptional regulator
MPGEYGDKRSVSVYIEKSVVDEIERLAESEGIQRSAFIANLIRKCLDKRS